jgi:nucleotide-binding universal stress UspA family protein
MRLKCPYFKILLPIDGSDHAIRAVHFTGYLGLSLRESLKEVVLLRVLTGRYMYDSIPYIDFRAEILKKSDAFTKFKHRYINTQVKPSLDTGEEILRKIGIEAQIKKLIAGGEPAREIARKAKKGNFSTIVMARRGLSEIMGILLGSVTSKVVHSVINQTVYIVGQSILKDKRCPIPKILVPVDGSTYSMRGVEHAVCLVRGLRNHIDTVTLLRVINLALYEKRFLKGSDPEEEARKTLEKAKQIFSQEGIPEGLVKLKIRVGKPADEIIKEADETGYNLIIMGRKGRTALKDLILGGVSSTVIQRCQNQTVAIVSGK